MSNPRRAAGDVFRMHGAPYVRLPASLFGHPAFAGREGLELLGFYMAMVGWARRYPEYETVPIIIITKLCGASSRGLRKAERLVAERFFDRVEGGYRIVDYAVLADTRDAIERKRRHGSVRAKATKLRPSIIDRDGLHCHICHGEVAPTDVHVDHVVAVANGGTSEPENLRVAHSTCNTRKGSTWLG